MLNKYIIYCLCALKGVRKEPMEVVPVEGREKMGSDFTLKETQKAKESNSIWKRQDR